MNYNILYGIEYTSSFNNIIKHNDPNYNIDKRQIV